MTARKDFRVVRDKFARDNGLPFGRLLSREYVLDTLESEGHYFRNRTFCPLVVLWGWLSQCLSQDKSLNEAVSRILAHRVSIGLPACSANSAGYTKGRTRFPESAMQCMAKEIGERVHRKADGSWNWNGREVFLVDGTTFSMPDTKENQLAYPKCNPDNSIGFPIMRAVALVSLATGAVLDMEFAKYAGKGTGEIGLFRKVSQSLPIGSIVVADRYYPTYSTMAGLKARGIDVVSISHAQREVDFSAGQILGPKDHIVQWTKGQVRDRINAEATAAYAALPETVSVREFVIDIDGRNGGKEQAIVVTTMTDPAIPQKEISDLYWTRWHCELDIRAIKQSLNLDVIRAKSPSMVRKEIWRICWPTISCVVRWSSQPSVTLCCPGN